MMSFSIASSGHEQAAEYLLAIEYRVSDLRPLALEVSDLIEVDNMAARMLGVDADGQPFRDLRPATLAKRHRGVGPPLAPMEMASRIISGLEMSIVDMGLAGIDVVGEWPSMPFLRHHVEGTVHMTARDPVGIRPQGWGQIEQALDRFGDSILP